MGINDIDYRKLQAFLLILVPLVFFRSFSAEFVNWDDNVFIYQNSLLNLDFFAYLKKIFSSPFHGDYIPLTMIFIFIQKNFLGFESQGFHSVSILLHMLNGFILFSILNRLKFSNASSIFALTLFLFHPLQVETVMWASEQKGLFACLFFGMSCLSLLKFRENKNYSSLFLSLFLFMFSLMSKSIFILFPLALLVLLGLKDIKTLVAFVLVTSLSGIIRVFAYFNVAGIEKASDISFVSYIVRPFKALSFYLYKFFLPINLSSYYREPQSLVIGVACLIGFISIVVAAYKFRERLNSKLLLFGFLALAPILHFVPRINFVSDRYMYSVIPMFSLFLFGIAEKKNFFSKTNALLVNAFVLVVLVVPSNLYSKNWTSSENLWKNAMEVSESSLSINNYALIQMNKGKKKLAISLFEKSLASKDSPAFRYLAANNLGYVYSAYPEIRNFNKALEYYEKSLRLAGKDSDKIFPMFNIGLIYSDIGDVDNSKKYLLKAKEIIRKINDVRYVNIDKKIQEELLKHAK